MMPPAKPSVAWGSECPLCRARTGKEKMLEAAPTLEDILFVGLVSGIVIGQTEKLDRRWCEGCRQYVEQLKGARPS
jgi:hypothetical protein